jgi:hypothetical protein
VRKSGRNRPPNVGAHLRFGDKNGKVTPNWAEINQCLGGAYIALHVCGALPRTKGVLGRKATLGSHTSTAMYAPPAKLRIDRALYNLTGLHHNPLSEKTYFGT